MRAVLQAYALLARHSRDTPLAAQLHRGHHVQHAQRQLLHFVRELLAEAMQSGRIRSDVHADELAQFCLHALGAAAGLRSRAAVHRLVSVTLDGLTAAGDPAAATDHTSASAPRS